MKISVITYHKVYNYGAALQAYATLKCFEKIGYDAELIDYIPRKVKNYGSFSQIYYESSLFYKNILKRFVVSLVKIPSYRRQRIVFDNFYEKYFKASKTYYSLDDLTTDPPQCDIYCTGSDQVWNNIYSRGFDLAYFLAFDEDTPKMSFSSSFGRKDFTSGEVDIMQIYLNKYTALTVREKSGLQYLSKTEAKLKANVLDPTLMLNVKEWLPFIQPVMYRRYILIYQLHGHSCAEEYAMCIAKNCGLQLIKIVVKLHEKANGMTSVIIPEVEKFLSLIYYADLIVTDSFHATAFSINFNKEFIACLPGKTGERIQSICEMVNLQNRIVESGVQAVERANQIIDYEHVNEMLEAERKKSLGYIKESVELCIENKREKQ